MPYTVVILISLNAFVCKLGSRILSDDLNGLDPVCATTVTCGHDIDFGHFADIFTITLKSVGTHQDFH